MKPLKTLNYMAFFENFACGNSRFGKPPLSATFAISLYPPFPATGFYRRKHSAGQAKCFPALFSPKAKTMRLPKIAMAI